MSISWHKIGLNEAEQKMLDELQDKKGYRVTEAFRAALRKLYKAEIPPYTKSKEQPSPWDHWTDDRICTDLLGGTIQGQHCVNVKGGRTVLLKDIKKYI